MTCSQQYCIDVLQDTENFIRKVFGDMRIISQDDVIVNGVSISMDFLRTVGIPQKVGARLEGIGRNFNTVTSPLTNVKVVLEQHGVPTPQEMVDNLCLNIIPLSKGRDTISITYIDILDQGTIKIFAFNPTKPMDKIIRFANSSIQQYITTLAFALTHWKNMPTNDEIDDNGIEFYEMFNQKFFQVIHSLDKRAIPSSEEEWNHSSQTATYWTWFYEYLTI